MRYEVPSGIRQLAEVVNISEFASPSQRGRNIFRLARFL